jgi:hypothetical protein
MFLAGQTQPCCSVIRNLAPLLTLGQHGTCLLTQPCCSAVARPITIWTRGNMDRSAAQRLEQVLGAQRREQKLAILAPPEGLGNESRLACTARGGWGRGCGRACDRGQGTLLLCSTGCRSKGPGCHGAYARASTTPTRAGKAGS